MCNVPCLLLRWSRCLLCWCSFLRWQEDLRGQRRNCCDVKKNAEKCRSIGVCKFSLEGKVISFQSVSYWCCRLIHFIHPITIFPDYLRTIVRISSPPPEQKDCVSSTVWMTVPGHQSFTNKSAVELWSAPMRIPDKMTSSRPRQCLFLPKHAPFCSLWRYWCFWLNCLFPQSWIQSSTPETSCIVVSTAATPPPTPPPPPPTPSLTDVLIPVWEEIPQETISRLLRRAPRPRESVHAGWRPCTLLSYSMSCLVQIQTF